MNDRATVNVRKQENDISSGKKYQKINNNQQFEIYASTLVLTFKTWYFNTICSN